MKLDQLLVHLPYSHQMNRQDNPTIVSIEMDSRNVTKGSLFVCIQGFTVDGHNFASLAEKNGASAVIAERELSLSIPVIVVSDTKRALAILATHFYGNPTKKLNLIGITGTNGKTTTSHIIEEILKKSGQKTGIIGTMYTKIGEKIYETKNTTPESLTLQSYFKEMVDAETDTAIMEVSSHALHLGRVRGCDFDLAVFTNLTPDHLDYHKTMEAYLYAKGLLFAQLGNTYDRRIKMAILNEDDRAADEFKKLTTAYVITYGIDRASDVMAINIEMNSAGTFFLLSTPKGKIPIQLKLIGKFNIYNALAAATACLVQGISLEAIRLGLESIDGVAGRFETVDAGQPYTVIVDYAHTPDSLENVLRTIQELTTGNIYTVVGCGGDRDRMKRPLMAQIASKYSHLAIFTADNPRSEMPESIVAEMTASLEADNYVAIIDRKEAISHAVSLAEAGDVVIIAGKGHETYQIIGKDVFPFDDRLIARQCIGERNQ